MRNENIVVQKGQIIVFIDRAFRTELEAIREAAKILQREVMYRETNSNKLFPR